MPETPLQVTSVNPPILYGMVASEEAGPSHQTAISRTPRYVTGESSSGAPEVIEVDEVPQESIWAVLEERGNVVPNIARNSSLESSLRQRLNAFGNEESLFFTLRKE